MTERKIEKLTRSRKKFSEYVDNRFGRRKKATVVEKLITKYMNKQKAKGNL